MGVSYTKQAIKYLRKLQPRKAETIRNKIRQIADGDAEGLNISAMHGEDNIYRLRIGDYRAIYEIQDEQLVLVVIKIGARGDVYK